VQYVANSTANDIAPSQTLQGFGFSATFSPSELAAAPNSDLSVACSGGLFSDAGDTFSVVSVPEPSPAVLLVIGALSWAVLTPRNERKAAHAHPPRCEIREIRGEFQGLQPEKRSNHGLH